MSTSALRLRDLRAIYELAHECRELGDDPLAWWRRLLARACRLVDADTAAGAEIAVGPLGPDNSFGLLGFLWGLGWGCEKNGFDHAGVEWTVAEVRSNPRFDPFLNAYWSRAKNDVGAALARPQVLSDAEWYSSTAYRNAFEPCGLDAQLFCARPISHEQNVFVDVLLARASRRKEFNERECARIRELMAVVVPLMGGPLARPTEPSPANLAPRVREVLRCLLEGDSDKQTAKRLEISKYTVNQYVKVIFNHFGVMTRAELLARWIRRGWGDGFAWATTDAPK